MQRNVPQLAHGYPSDARSSLLQERQVIASRSRRVWGISAIHESRRGQFTLRRTRQSTSRSAFHNALRRLQPGREPIGPRFLPAGRHGRKATFFALAFETQPAVAELGRNYDLSAKWTLATVGGVTAVGQARRCFTCGLTDATVNPSALRSGGRYQPHFPPLTPRVSKGPVTHRASSVADSAPWIKLRSLQCRVGAKAGVALRL